MVGGRIGGSLGDGRTRGDRKSRPCRAASAEARFVVTEDSHSDGASGAALDSPQSADGPRAGDTARKRSNARGIAHGAGAVTGISGRNERPQPARILLEAPGSRNIKH